LSNEGRTLGIVYWPDAAHAPGGTCPLPVRTSSASEFAHGASEVAMQGCPCSFGKLQEDPVPGTLTTRHLRFGTIRSPDQLHHEILHNHAYRTISSQTAETTRSPTLHLRLAPRIGKGSHRTHRSTKKPTRSRPVNIYSLRQAYRSSGITSFCTQPKTAS